MEASLRKTRFGLVYDGPGWFVVNAREARWDAWDRLGVYCNFEGKRRFPHFGINLNVLEPGESLGRYHAEQAQEDFLVLAGACLLVVEDEERTLEPWDFVHCPSGTPHMIVGAGSGPSVVLAVGARGRGRRGLEYIVSEVAARHGISVSAPTTKPAEAYADLRGRERVAYREGWLPDL